jgi:predicted nucleotidyltransferase
MGIADKFLNARVKLDMTVEEFSQLTTILTVVAMESQNFDKETARKVLDYQSSFLALLTAVLNSSEDAQKVLLSKTNDAVKGKIRRAVVEAAKQAEVEHDKKKAAKEAISEAERIIREAMEGK